MWGGGGVVGGCESAPFRSATVLCFYPRDTFRLKLIFQFYLSVDQLEDTSAES